VKSTIQSVRSPAAWLTLLSRPESRVEIDLHGVPSYYVARPGWNTQPRPFGQHLLYYVVKGSFRVRVKEREEVLGVGDLLWIAPWMSFRCWLLGDKPVSFYRFRLEVKNRRAQSFTLRGAPLIVRGIEPAHRWIEEIIRPGRQGEVVLESWRLRGALLGLFADILAPKASRVPGDGFNARQKSILAEWIHQNSAVRGTPAQLAARLQMSADYFSRLFRKTYGISPRAWIVRERIRMAAVRLLESNLNIGEVAAEFGYRDIFFFSRQFKQVIGRSPKTYRRDV
jgi:AraC-like DNA-binding protein